MESHPQIIIGSGSTTIVNYGSINLINPNPKKPKKNILRRFVKWLVRVVVF